MCVSPGLGPSEQRMPGHGEGARRGEIGETESEKPDSCAPDMGHNAQRTTAQARIKKDDKISHKGGMGGHHHRRSLILIVWLPSVLSVSAVMERVGRFGYLEISREGRPPRGPKLDRFFWRALREALCSVCARCSLGRR